MFSKKCFSFYVTLYFHVQSHNLYLMTFDIYFKITEMAKEPMLSPTTESVYPALVNCAASVDIILPQITSNMW